jgi:hypothetical protein
MTEATKYTAVEATESLKAPTFTGNVVGNVTGNITGNQTETLTAVVGTTTATRAGGAAITNNGIATIGSTSGQKNYTLAAPAAGVHKTIICTAGSTDNLSVVMASTGVTFDGTNTVATFNGADDTLDLVGLSATR